MVSLFEALTIAETHLADGNLEAGHQLLASIAEQRPNEPAPAHMLGAAHARPPAPTKQPSSG